MPESRSRFQPPASSSLIPDISRHKQGSGEAPLTDISARGRLSAVFDFAIGVATICVLLRSRFAGVCLLMIEGDQYERSPIQVSRAVCRLVAIAVVRSTV